MEIKDPTNHSIPIDQSNFVLGCYAVSLIQGDSILGMNILSATIKKYIQAAAALYTARRIENPYEPEDNQLDENFPDIIIKALKKYEKIPKRREVITDSMFVYINEKAQDSREDSLENAFKDWAAWSRYSGPRRSEWCQTRKTKFETVTDGPEDKALAIRASDITFYDATGRVINPDCQTFARVTYAEVVWRYKKNGENGEAIKYYKDDLNKVWCPCKAIWNIIQRAARLRIKKNEPIAKYQDEKGHVFFITDKDVKIILQEAAKEMLNITDEKVLSKWTSHSLRVTAANELHRLGFSAAFIQHRLRWRSDAFMVYLRHTIHVARNHTKEMSMSLQNLTLRKSNLESMNKKAKKIENKYRTPDSEDILWQQKPHAPAA